LNLQDVNCSFKLFRKSALDNITLTSNGFSIDTELIVKAMISNKSIKEFAVKHLPRQHGESKVKKLHALSTLHELTKLWWEIRKNK